MGENFTNGQGEFLDNNLREKDESEQAPVSENLDTKSSLDIDELQEMIMKQMSADEADQKDYFDDFESAENYAQDSGSLLYSSGEDSSVESQYYDISPREKKYVVSIKPDIVPMFDQLAPEDRAELVNKLVLNYMESKKHTPEEERIKKLITHSIVVFITIAVGFPVIFFLTNASIEATVNSYRQIQNNFEKLYLQKGGIKRKDLTKIQSLQY